MAAPRLSAPCAAFSLVLAVCAGAPGQSQVTWTNLLTFSPGFAATGLTIADVTGSPLPDILMTTGSGNILRILENQGPLQVPPAIDVPVGAGPTEIAAADLDGDGDRDLVTRNVATVSVLIRQAPGTYARTDYSLTGPGRLGIADVDVNGLPDIVRGSHAILATAPGVYGAVTALFGTLANPVDAAMGDFDGNGSADFAVVYTTTTVLPTTPAPLAVDLHLNAGNGTFGTTTTTLLPAVFGFGYTCGDVDQDGDSDLILFTAVPWVVAWVFPGAPGGVLPPLTPEYVGYATSYDAVFKPRIADVDGDGKLDAILHVTVPHGIPNYTDTWTAALINDGTGRLRMVGSPASGELANAFPPAPPCAVGDLDGDGDGDYVAQKLGLLGVVVKLAQVGPPLAFPAPATLVPVTPTAVTVRVGAQFPPLAVAVLDASGAPVPNAPVTFTAVSGANLITPMPISPAFTGPNGVVTSLFGATTQNVSAALANGQAVVVASSPGLPSVTFTVDVKPLTIAVASGNNQTVTVGTVTPLPLTAVVTDALGVPASGVPVSFVNYLPAGSVSLSFTAGPAGYTNASGQISITCGCPNVGTGHVWACVGNIATGQVAQFTVNVVPPSYTLAINAGNGQAVDFGETFPTPLSVIVSNGAAGPQSGVPVIWTVSPPGAAAFQPASPTLTNGVGLASIVVTSSVGGPIVVSASVPGTAPPVAFSLFTRILGATGSAASGSITITYSHEHGPVPFILAADVPQPTSLTPFGLVHTSILAPGPALVYLDGMGAFGPPDPSIVANPGFTATFGLPPTVAGLSIVLEAYGLDPAYLPNLSQAIFISNAVPKTL